MGRRIIDKDSGFRILDNVPKNWKVERLKDLGPLQNGVSKGKEYFGVGSPFVSYGNVYNDSIELKKIKKLANSNKSEQKLYSVVEGDIFFTRTSETIDEIGISATAAETIPKATFSGFVIRLRPKRNKIRKGFSKYYFQSTLNRQLLSKEINLVTRASLSQGILNMTPVLLPPKEEQIQITSYLDSKTQAIDNKIKLLQKKNGVYKEYRKALINETVTKGLDKQVKLKNSGIEWIDEIPDHWKVHRLKDFGNLSTSSVNKKIEEGEKIVSLVNYTNVYGNPFNQLWNGEKYMRVSAKQNQIKDKKLIQGDVLFTPSSETAEDIGASAVVMENLPNTLYSYHLLRMRFKKNIDNNFKRYLFNNENVQYYLSKNAKGTTRKILGLNDFNNLQVPLPPYQEQIEISAFLERKTIAIDKIEGNIRSQIKYLKELRKTLINDVVTGKIKVTE
jgi:type I restriction enzyme S subunit